MRQSRGCAERAVIAKIKGKKSVERRSLFMFFTQLKLKQRVPNKTEVKVIYTLIAMRAVKYHLLQRVGIANFT